MRIFVSICSYRDPLLYETIKSLRDTTSGLCEIKIGIFEQIKYEDSLAANYPEIANSFDVLYKRIDPEYSDGVGWARHINSLQLTNEDFYYQIDSHALFDQNWDRNLINDYKLAVEKYNTHKVIITSNCKNYSLDENNKPVRRETTRHACAARFYSFRKDFKIGAHGDWIDPQPTVTDAYHIFAGNLFTHADWVRQVGINPKMYFHGEEQHLTLTSFFAGYKICHGREINNYHFLGSNEHVTKQGISPVISTKRRRELQQISDGEFYNYLISITDEEFEEFRKYSGVDYVNRKLEKRAISKSMARPADADWEAPDRLE